MNKDQIIYEMSNRTSNIQEQNVQLEYDNLHTENGSHQHNFNVPSVMEELPMGSTSQISSTSEINCTETKLSPSLPLKNNLTTDIQPHTTSKKQPVKPCVVVLQRSQTVEAAWQREQLRRQKKRSSPQSGSTKSGGSTKDCNTQGNKKRCIPLNCVERSEAGFICQLCGNTFPGHTSFMQHVRAEHSSTCDVCAKVLSSTQKLKDHLRFVHGKSQTSWEEKLFISHPLKYPCTFCHKKFGSQSSLDKHTIFKHSTMDLESSHSENNELNSFKCEYCNDGFDNKLHLREHIFEKHIDEQEKIENTEDTSQSMFDELSQPSSSNIEENKTTGPSGPPVTAYECPHCLTLHANKDRFKKHLGFVWPESFSEHQVSVDPQMLARQKEPVACEVCGARAANLAFLHTHQSSHPELTRPHVCPDPCNRKFLFRCQLDRHALIHQVGAPAKCKPSSDSKQISDTGQSGRHRCTICCKRTRSEARLLAHIACCHKGNIEYRCKICDVCFPSAKSLGRHCNKKQHLHDEQNNHSNEPWVSPETPCISVLNNTHNNITHSVRPDSLGSSDSVSTSDAFSMYFQSLHSLGSLDMALDIGGGNASIFENVDDVLAPAATRSTCFTSDPTAVTSQILHGRPAYTEITEMNNQDNGDPGSELQFHTLQTVPVEPLSELEATYLQNMKVEPLTQIEPSATLQTMEVETLVQNEPLFMKTEPMETTQVVTSILQNISENTNHTVNKLESTFEQNVQETTELSQLESFLVLSNDLQNQYPINIDDICSVNETPNMLSVRTPEVVSNVPPSHAPIQVTTPIKEENHSKMSTLDTSQQYSMNIDNCMKEKLEVSNTSNLQSKCDSTKISFTAAIKIENKNVDLDTIPDVTNISFLPELNETDCNIQLLADTCDSSSLSDLGISLSGEVSSKPKHQKKPGGSCPDCGKIFSSAHSAARHAKLSCPGRDPKSLQVCCPQCDVVLADRKELHKHKREVHPDTLFTCSACTKTFFLAQSLARHQKESCSHRETFPCRQCKVLMSSVEELRSHTAEQHPGVLATCEICGKTLSSAQSLRRHLRSHKPGDTSPPSTEHPIQSTEKEKQETTPIITNSDNKTKIKCEKKKKKKKVDETLTQNTLDQTLTLPLIEAVRNNLIEDEEMLHDTFDIKTGVDIDSKDESQVGSLADDLLSDFASISTNQLFNGNLNGESDLQEEFNISDMFLIKNGALQCDFCEASFPTDKLLLHHLSSQHFPNTQWQPAQPSSQNGASVVASLNVASTSTQSAGSQCDLPTTSF